MKWETPLGFDEDHVYVACFGQIVSRKQQAIVIQQTNDVV